MIKLTVNCLRTADVEPEILRRRVLRDVLDAQGPNGCGIASAARARFTSTANRCARAPSRSPPPRASRSPPSRASRSAVACTRCSRRGSTTTSQCGDRQGGRGGRAAEEESQSHRQGHRRVDDQHLPLRHLCARIRSAIHAAATAMKPAKARHKGGDHDDSICPRQLSSPPRSAG